MATDPSPLLRSSTPNRGPRQPSFYYSTIDDTIEKFLGGGGRGQFFQAILAASGWVFDSQHTFISVFTDAPASWHCISSTPCGPSAATITPPCSLPSSSWAWDRPTHSSVVSEWSLDCISPSVKGFPASAFLFGCLCGGVALATLADTTLGRKKMLFLSCLCMSLSGILTAFSPNIWVYVILRFVSGFWRATLGTSCLVLSSEIVGKRWRDQVSITGFFLFTVGFLSLPAMAYVARDWSWRWLYLMTSIPALLYSVLVYFILKESPRWLLVRGRKEEAIQVFKDLAVWNGEGEEDAVNGSYSQSDCLQGNSTDDEVVDLFSALKRLVGKSWSLRRLLALSVVGFGVGMVYYGMPLAAGGLGFNLYLSVTFNALAELPSSLLMFFFVDRMSRKGSVLGFTALSGLCNLACAALKRRGVLIRMAAEVVAFFSACAAFCMVLIHSLELFPTGVRNSAVAVVRQALVFGGVLAPLLVAAGERGSGGFLPFGAFGLVIGCCGLFVAFLKETRGEAMSDTMEEEEHKEVAAAAAGGSGDKCSP